jgi:hypothetical protein
MDRIRGVARRRDNPRRASSLPLDRRLPSVVGFHVTTRHISQQKKELFLTAFAETCTVTHAADAAGIDRRTHYDWLKADQEYAEQFRAAEQSVADSLEAEAIRRARDGVERDVYYKGEVVGTERQLSDTLLIFLLKGHKPDKFKDRHQVTAEVTHHDVSDFDRAVSELLDEFDRRGASGSPMEAQPPPSPDRT